LTKHLIELTVNGKRHTIETDANKTLLWILRHKLGLTGAKPACERGDCGLCTILLDDEPVKSCLVLAVEANAHKITTIEGISKEGALSTLQTKFIEHGALQCGFCTPAAVLVATALLKRNPSPTREQVVESVEGVLCRCTGYSKIVEAIAVAGEKMKE
jgi:carbon-monoxide dehydrogenase small subunit